MTNLWFEYTLGGNFALKLIFMAIIGYITNSGAIDKTLLEVTRDTMKTLHCDNVYEDLTHDNTERPWLKYIMEEAKEGDTIVFHKLSNALANLVELTNLFRLCKSRQIRLVSVADQIDTSMLLYDSTAKDMMLCLTTFSAESYTDKHKSKKLEHVPDSAKVIEKRRLRDEREMKIVQMYISEFSYEEIKKAIGVSSSRTITHVLRKHGIQFCRKKYDRMGIEQGINDAESNTKDT